MARPPIHPGVILADALTELGISANQLGKALHIPDKALSIGWSRSPTRDTRASRTSRGNGSAVQPEVSVALTARKPLGWEIV